MIFLSAWGLRTLQQKGHRGQSANGANHSELSLHDKFTRTDYTLLLFQASVIRENTVTFLFPKRKSAILLCWDASEGHLKKKKPQRHSLSCIRLQTQSREKVLAAGAEINTQIRSYSQISSFHWGPNAKPQQATPGEDAHLTGLITIPVIQETLSF